MLNKISDMSRHRLGMTERLNNNTKQNKTIIIIMIIAHLLVNFTAMQIPRYPEVSDS